MSKIGSGGGHTREGAQPVSIPDVKRIRSYYRALKRKESWAIYLSKLSLIQFLLQWMYGRGDCLSTLIYKENPFLKMAKEFGGSWTGSFIPFPSDWPGRGGCRKRQYYRRHKSN